MAILTKKGAKAPHQLGRVKAPRISRDRRGVGAAPITELSHNIPRLMPKDVTSYITDGTFWGRLNGTGGFSLFEDIYTGDYIKMSRPITAPQSSVTGSEYVTIAGLDSLMGMGEYAGNRRINYHHAVMVPGYINGGRVQHFGKGYANKSYSTVGGYRASFVNTDLIGPVTQAGDIGSKATINQQLKKEWKDHLKTISASLSNSINAEGYNRFGKNSGCVDGWEWTNIQAILMSEVELYGSIIWSSSGYDAAECRQLPLFAYGQLYDLGVASAAAEDDYYLRDVVSSGYFALKAGTRRAFWGNAQEAYIRPRFVLA